MAFDTSFDDKLAVLGDNTLVIGTLMLGTSFGQIVTAKVTRITCGLFDAPGACRMIAPVYDVPATNPAVLTMETVKAWGVTPVSGVTLSQLPPLHS